MISRNGVIASILLLLILLLLKPITSYGSDAPLSWHEPVKVPEMRAKRVSAVWYRNQLHLVHGGPDSNDLWHASWDGADWTINRISNLPGESRGTPAVAVFQGALHMVYRDKNGSLWHATSTGKEWTSKGKIPGQKSHIDPSLVIYSYDMATGKPAERLWLFHGGGSHDTRSNTWFSYFDGTVWVENQKMLGYSQQPVALVQHQGKLYKASIYEEGITLVRFDNMIGWRQASDVPQLPGSVHSAVPVSLVSDGTDLYCFFRNSRRGPGAEEPLLMSTLSGARWSPPVQVGNLVSSDAPAAVPIPGASGQFYLVFTRNSEIYVASNKALRPLKPVLKR